MQYTTSYAYDTENNLTSITDANNHATSFTYNANRWVTRTTFPSTLTENYTYDLNGNLKTKTDRKNQTITYSYDPLNRLTQKTYPDSSTVAYTYDNASRLTQVVDPTGTYSFAFDNMDRLTGTTTAYAFLTSRNFAANYAYDAASNRTSFTDPESGSTTYAYDTLNRLSTLTPPSAFTGSGNFGFAYDAISRRTQVTRPNNVTTNYAYDNLSRLTSVLHQLSGSTIDGAIYTVDNAGNQTAMTDKKTNVTSNYTYDSVYQLIIAAQSGSNTESYSYDPVGNRTASLGVSSYTTNSSNELTAMTGASYAYDNNGNTTSKTISSNTTNYAWDYENRMTTVTLPGSGGTVSFVYDPFGRRIKKVSSSGTSIFAYDGDNLIEETNSSGTVVARYSQGLNIDEPLAMLRSSTTSYYNADGLGSITSLANTLGTLAQTYTFDSFGKQTSSSGSLTNPFQYTARESDPETGLYYFRARYYDPTSGRFTTEDPIGFAGGINSYSYVENNVTTFVDPTGLSPCIDVDEFVKALDNNAEKASTGRCAHYVRIALEAGGADTTGHPRDAKNYGPLLKKNGFAEVPDDDYVPQLGDVIVFQPFPGGNSAGHIQGFDGVQHVSDFKQPYPASLPGGIYPGKNYRKSKPLHTIYRPTPCPVSAAERGLIRELNDWLHNGFTQ